MPSFMFCHVNYCCYFNCFYFFHVMSKKYQYIINEAKVGVNVHEINSKYDQLKKNQEN